MTMESQSIVAKSKLNKKLKTKNSLTENNDEKSLTPEEDASFLSKSKSNILKNQERNIKNGEISFKSPAMIKENLRFSSGPSQDH